MRILIIGSGPGLSHSIAQHFGKEGFHITLVARTESKLQEEVLSLQASGIRTDYRICDVSNQQAFTALLESEKENLPEVVLFNAFTGGNGSIETETWHSLQQQMNINTGAAFNTLKTLLPEYRKTEKGKLFFTGGGLGIHPHPDYLGIGMTKAALRNLIHATAGSPENTSIHIATVTILGFINGDDPKYASDRIAEEYWKLYQQQERDFQTEIVY